MVETASVVAPIADEDRVLSLTRLFQAPVRLVYRMWTEPEHVARWWGCSGSTVTRFTRDLRVGGDFFVEMRLSDGSLHRITGVYREIEEASRLCFTWGWLDDDGKRSNETLVTVTFAERSQATEVTLRHELFETTELRDLHGQGWGVGLDRLAAYLAEVGPSAR